MLREKYLCVGVKHYDTILRNLLELICLGNMQPIAKPKAPEELPNQHAAFLQLLPVSSEDLLALSPAYDDGPNPGIFILKMFEAVVSTCFNFSTCSNIMAQPWSSDCLSTVFRNVASSDFRLANSC